MDIGKGEKKLVELLKKEGRLLEVMKLLERGRRDDALKIIEDIVAKNRADFDEEMGLK